MILNIEKKYRCMLGHILFWTISFVVFNLEIFVNVYKNPDSEHNRMVEEIVYDLIHNNVWVLFLYDFYGAILNIALFYLCLKVFIPKVMIKNRWIIFIILIIVTSLLVSAFETYIDHVFRVFFYPQYSLDMFEENFTDNFILNIFMMLLAVCYYFYIQWRRNIEREQFEKQERLKAELAYLRSQVNPHFLFNTLNNLFASARKHKDYETSAGITKLAGLMRYMLYDSNIEFIELKHEIDYIKNYIELQSLRFLKDDNIDICFELVGNFSGVYISPMLLIPFVENAYKHGISLSKKSMIDISLKVDNDKNITFICKNLIVRKHKDNSDHSGIGLDNVSKRLDLIYPEKHLLLVESDSDEYKVELSIDTKR